ncbi:MAG: hypothetical protein FWB76_04380 [Oscillospiraceae bacterium]|nr:hypothetical protein [Oscillospiraceae bacterium]
MTTNTTWTTVNGVVMPGSGTQTFGGNCVPPFCMPGGMLGVPGFGMPPTCLGNPWMPCGMPTCTAGSQGLPFGM